MSEAQGARREWSTRSEVDTAKLTRPAEEDLLKSCTDAASSSSITTTDEGYEVFGSFESNTSSSVPPPAYLIPSWDRIRLRCVVTLLSKLPQPFPLMQRYPIA